MKLKLKFVFRRHVGLILFILVFLAFSGWDQSGVGELTAKPLQIQPKGVVSADLVLSMLDAPDPVTAGNNLVYTITVTNNGPSDAFEVVVADTLPAGVTFISTSGCAEDPNGVPDCFLGPVAAGGSAQYTITVMVQPSTTGTLTNTASVTFAGVESNPGDESASEMTSVATAADLTVSKTDSVDPVTAGTSLTYLVTVENNGPSDAQQVVVTDTLPADVTLLSTAGCAEDPGGVPTCTLGAVGAGKSSEYSITVSVDGSAAGPLVNSSTVTSATPEAGPGDETATETTDVVAEADLILFKSDSADPVTAGTELTYTVSVGNVGPSDAQNVVVTDNLPAGVTLISTSGCSEDPVGVPTCTLGTVPGAEGSREYTITVAVDASASDVLENHASVTSSATEIGPGDEEDFELTQVATVADLVLTKIDAADPVLAGEDVVYIVTVTNNGPSDARNVVVNETLPAELSLVSTSGCSEDPAGVPVCTLGTVAAGASVQYSVTASSDGSMTGEVVNTAQVTSTTEEGNPGDEEVAETTTLVTGADLSVQIADQPDPVRVGDELNYTVTVANSGPGGSSGGSLTAILDGATQFVSVLGPCAHHSGVVTCSVGDLGVGESSSVEIVVTILPQAPESLRLEAEVAGGGPDPDPTNNQAVARTTVDLATDLALELSSSPEPAPLGGTIVFTAIVENLGPTAATTAFLRWSLPAGVSFESVDVFPRGTCTPSPSRVTCNFGTIRVGEIFRLELSASADQPGTMVTSASVASLNVESEPADNARRLTFQVIAGADLALTKETDFELVAAGLPLTYQLQVFNRGPLRATGIIVTDTLPTGVSAITEELPETCRVEEAEEPGGDDDSVRQVVCEIGDLDPDQETTIHLPVLVEAGLRGDFSNQAVTSAEEEDSDQSNNLATVTNRAAERGDLNGDGAVDALDLSVLLRELNDGDGTLLEDVGGGDFSGNALFDLNADGMVDRADLEELVTLVLGR